MIIFLKKYWPIISVLLLSAILRFIAIGKYGDFWNDEMFSFVYSQKTWAEGIRYWILETNPPLHLLILKVWLAIFPNTEFWTRLPSLIFGVGSVYLIYILGKTLLDKTTGILVAFYLAIHPYHIFWSATARTYALLILLVIFSTLLFWKIFFIKKDFTSSKILSPIVNFLLIFSHLGALFVLTSQFLTLLMSKGIKPALQWIKINIIAFLFGGVWIIISFLSKINNKLEDAWFFNINHSIETVINPLLNLVVGQYSLVFGIVLLLFFTLIIIIGLRKKIYYTKNKIYPILILTFTPILLSAMLNVWNIKFFIAILPLMVIILTWSLLKTIRYKIVVIILITLICVPGLLNLWNTLPISNWKQVEKFITDTKVQDKSYAIIYNNFYLKIQLDYYLQEYKNKLIPLTLYDSTNFDEMIVKKNYIFNIATKEKITEWYNQNNLDKYSAIILLQSEYDSINKLDGLMMENNWKLIEKKEKVKLSGKYILYYYEKN